MKHVVFAGSFDPLTNGHLDIIERACQIADRVTVAVGVNTEKTTHFTLTQRMRMISTACQHLDRVDVAEMEGTLVDFCRAQQISVAVRGVRNNNDLSTETAMAAFNRDIGEIETIFLPTRVEYAHISSSAVRELLTWGMDISRYVPQSIIPIIEDNRTQDDRDRSGEGHTYYD